MVPVLGNWFEIPRGLMKFRGDFEMAQNIFAYALIVLITGCAVTQPENDSGSDSSPARTEASRIAGYTYLPVDPFPVLIDNSCLMSDTYESVQGNESNEVLKLFPDNAVRMSVERFDQSGKISYGVGSIGVEGNSYRVTVDYVNVDTTNIIVFIAKYCYDANRNALTTQFLNQCPSSHGEGMAYTVERVPKTSEDEDWFPSTLASTGFSIPVYVGVGLRITADVLVQKGNVNISGLGAIGAEASADRLRGSLVVQTLGINGKSIAAALPIQSELNRTTTQDAIVAVGTIKSLLYESGTRIAPRVVGLYLPFPAEQSLVNAIISELSNEPVPWSPGCGIMR